MRWCDGGLHQALSRWLFHPAYILLLIQPAGSRLATRTLSQAEQPFAPLRSHAGAAAGSALLPDGRGAAGCDPRLPAFHVRTEGWDFHLKPEVAGYWGRVHELLLAHPCRRREEAGAALVFVGTVAGCLHVLPALPPRPPGSAYVVLAHGLQLDHCSTRPDAVCQAAQLALQSRRDVLYVNLDLRDHALLWDQAPALPGVTFAPPHFFAGGRPAPEGLGTWRWLLSYRGVRRPGWFGSSSARPTLDGAFRAYSDPRAAIEFLPVGHRLTQRDTDRYAELLRGSAFALVPHGDGRWSYRLSEVVGACAVPVIMANGLTLPYEEIIDWSGAAIRVDEALAAHPEQLLAQLPQDPRVVQAMRQRVCGISAAYFESMEKRVDAMLLSLAARVTPFR